ncbi:hypothetical protein Pelo_17616 [Pelomyxa schiedti]|nr:hypothetical protein Pelo_17616 [Pelomyxa schiedti]
MGRLRTHTGCTCTLSHFSIFVACHNGSPFIGTRLVHSANFAACVSSLVNERGWFSYVNIMTYLISPLCMRREQEPAASSSAFSLPPTLAGSNYLNLSGHRSVASPGNQALRRHLVITGRITNGYLLMNEASPTPVASLMALCARVDFALESGSPAVKATATGGSLLITELLIIPFKGLVRWRVCMRDKPRGTGVKVFLLVDEYSAIVKFIMYDSDNPYVDLDHNLTLLSPFFRDLNLTEASLRPTEATVYSLLSAVHWNQATRVSMDRYFPMANLMRNLHNSGFEFIVTCQTNRAGQIFSEFISQPDPEMEWNKCEFHLSMMKQHPITALIYEDNCRVNFLSNFISAGAFAPVNHKTPHLDNSAFDEYNKFVTMVKPGVCGNDKPFKVGLEFIPSMVHNYRFSYHNVDRVNQYPSRYGVNHRHHKWTTKCAWVFLIWGTNQARLLYCAANHCQIGMQQFLISVLMVITSKFLCPMILLLNPLSLLGVDTPLLSPTQILPDNCYHRLITIAISVWCQCTSQPSCAVGNAGIAELTGYSTLTGLQ